MLLPHEHRQRIERVEEEVGVDLPDEHVVARGEVLVLEQLVLDHHGLTLRDQHVDPPVEHRGHHGERTLEQQHVVEHLPAHAVERDAFRVPLRDGRQAVERDGGQAAPQAPPDEAAHRVVAAHGGEDREDDERDHEVIEELQEQFGHPRRARIEAPVVEFLPVVAAHLPQHRVALRVPRGHQVGDDPVAGGDPEPAHALRGDVDAVAVFVDEVSVAVGMHRQKPFVAAFEDLLVRRAGLALVGHVDEHQQHVGEVHHQTDHHGDHQVQHKVGIFRLELHVREVSGFGVAARMAGRRRRATPRRGYTTRHRACSRGPCGARSHRAARG